MTDAWSRMHEVLSHMSERLDYQEGETKKIFRDSLVENARDLCDVLKHLNITGDLKLEEMRKNLEKQLSGVSAEDLREDDGLRNQTKEVVDQMLKKFSI
jgi:hypothetical protein